MNTGNKLGIEKMARGGGVGQKFSKDVIRDQKLAKKHTHHQGTSFKPRIVELLSKTKFCSHN
jgi:hypothetical protein